MNISIYKNRCKPKSRQWWTFPGKLFKAPMEFWKSVARCCLGTWITCTPLSFQKKCLKNRLFENMMLAPFFWTVSEDGSGVNIMIPPEMNMPLPNMAMILHSNTFSTSIVSQTKWVISWYHKILAISIVPAFKNTRCSRLDYQGRAFSDSDLQVSQNVLEADEESRHYQRVYPWKSNGLGKMNFLRWE